MSDDRSGPPPAHGEVEDTQPPSAVSRRGFLKGAGGLAAGGALGVEGAAAAATLEPQARVYRFEGRVPLELTINGEPRTITCEPRTTLLDLLRVHCDPPLTGAKEVCDRGACGACTVLLDGEPVYACNTLAAYCYLREVVTIEGLTEGSELTPVQKAFCREDALMCGFCTPGFVMSVTACLEADPSASEDAIRAACAGNVCRCGTYPQIWKAAREAGAELAARTPDAPAGDEEDGR